MLTGRAVSAQACSFNLQSPIVKLTGFVLIATFLPFMCAAQTKRGIMVREAPMYVQTDTHSAKLATIQRGREVAIMEQSQGFVKVFAELGGGSEFSSGRQITGWILDKGIVRDEQPNADRIIF